jgi:hypothetical protein
MTESIALRYLVKPNATWVISGTLRFGVEFIPLLAASIVHPDLGIPSRETPLCAGATSYLLRAIPGDRSDR